MYIDNLEILILATCLGVSLTYIAYLGIRHKLFKIKGWLMYMALGCSVMCIGMFMVFIYDPLGSQHGKAFRLIADLGLILIFIGGGFWWIGYYKAHKIIRKTKMTGSMS